MDYHLQKLEKKSIYIIREANAKFKKIGVMWSRGENFPVLLHLCNKAFFGRMPFTVVKQADQKHKFEALLMPTRKDSPSQGPETFIRVYPLLSWQEIDIWEYIKENNIPVESNAKTIDEIIEKLKTTEMAQRRGRAEEKEKEEVMKRLRELGYRRDI